MAINIVFNISTLIIVLTITNSNFFYNNYSIKHFITLNRLILIKTVENIIIFINNNAFIYSFTSSTVGITRDTYSNRPES